jgi:hypothetical protein
VVPVPDELSEKFPSLDCADTVEVDIATSEAYGQRPTQTGVPEAAGRRTKATSQGNPTEERVKNLRRGQCNIHPVELGFVKSLVAYNNICACGSTVIRLSWYALRRSDEIVKPLSREKQHSSEKGSGCERVR